MSLHEITQRARALVAAGAFDEAETVLTEGSILLRDEPDVAVLAAYATACQQWGSDECQEQALREAVQRECRLREVLALLELLQERLNSLQGPERLRVALECSALGTDAIALVGASDVETLANLRYNRGLRQLDLAREGATDRLDVAAADIAAFLNWVAVSTTLPEHVRRGNIAAFAETDLAEVRLLQGKADEASMLLRHAIEKLEGDNVATWLTQRSYALLERAQKP